MNDSILAKYRTARQAAATVDDTEAVPPGNDNEDVEEVGPFGWLRGVRDRAVMLELRRKDGSSIAFDYALLRKVEHDPSEGLTLHFSGEEIKIEGRNLAKDVRPGVQLKQGILWHRVPWIREMSDADIVRAGEEATVVEGFRL